MAARVITSPAYRDRYRQPERFSPCVERDDFDQQRLSFDELLSVLKANFATPEGEKVRARLINRFEKYGNDIDEVDNISAELLRHYCKEVENTRTARRLLHAGIVYRFCSCPVGSGGWRDARRSLCRRATGRRWLVTHAGSGRTRTNGGTEISQ